MQQAFHKQATGTNEDAAMVRAEKSPLDGPAFKDQCRTVADGGPVPAFKDQVRRALLNPDGQVPPSPASGIVFADAQLLDSSNLRGQDEIVLPAHVLEMNFGTKKKPSGRRVTKQTKVVASVLLILIVAAALVAGICGAGKCSSGQDDATRGPTSPPTVPTLSPRDISNILSFVNNITFTSEMIHYPNPTEPSAEELAVQWLVEDDPLHLSVETTEDQAQLTQRYALLTLFYSTNGPTFWTNKTNWLTKEHECKWFGIFCVQNKVRDIDLRDNNLVGTIPTDLALLAQTLIVLWLLDNSNLVGSLPSTIGELVNLQSLSVEHCSMSGSLPDAIGNMTSLTDFWIQRDQFTGKLPESIGQWSQLVWFNVHRNSLTGSLPAAIGEWSSVEQFRAGDNAFTGTLPESITQWSNLVHFEVYNNKFTGPLPESVGQWSKLNAFHVRDNSFTGRLPELIGQWTNMAEFHVFRNQLTGSLPESIGNWTALKIFSVHSNAFTGPIPETVLAWENIKEAWFSANEFVGTMPFCNSSLSFPSGQNDVLEVDCDEVKCGCCTTCY